MRYFVGFLVTIGLIILAFVLIFNITGRNDNRSGTQPAGKTALTSYAATTKQMRLTVDGPINAASEHRRIDISVGQNQTVITVQSGYNGSVLRSQTYDNTQESYRNFLYALDGAGYTRGKTDPNLANEQGTCPLGRRLSYDIWDGADRQQHFWTTSCGGGTFEGNSNTVNNLFEAQVPNFDEITRGLDY